MTYSLINKHLTTSISLSLSFPLFLIPIGSLVRSDSQPLRDFNENRLSTFEAAYLRGVCVAVVA